MTDVQVFENQQFGKIRTLIIDSVIWFAGKDVAEILGYKDTKKRSRITLTTEIKCLLLKRIWDKWRQNQKGVKQHLCVMTRSLPLTVLAG